MNRVGVEVVDEPGRLELAASSAAARTRGAAWSVLMFTLKSTPMRSKNVSGDGDEPDLDRDFQVLQAPQGLQQVGDLLLDVRRLVDDQGHASGIVLDRARPAHVAHDSGETLDVINS